MNRAVVPFLLLGAGCSLLSAGGDDPARYREPTNPAAVAALAKARQLLAEDAPAAALPLLRQVVEACPDCVPAHTAWQDAARSIGGEAWAALTSFYGQPQPGAAPVVAAYNAARLLETPFAQDRALRELVARDPRFAFARLALARLQRGRGKLLPAVEFYAAALDLDPGLVEARLERAAVLAELGRHDAAAAEYEAYLRSVPDDRRAQRAYVELCLYQLGAVDRALPHLERLLALAGGRDIGLLMDRAAAFWLAGDPRTAVQAYLEVLAAAPQEPRALLNIGLLYYEVLPKVAADRVRYWPKARLAFDRFLAGPPSADGHEQFERMLAVPFRLDVIEALLGPRLAGDPQPADLALPQ